MSTSSTAPNQRQLPTGKIEVAPRAIGMPVARVNVRVQGLKN
jgi:hypothetical protein